MLPGFTLPATSVFSFNELNVDNSDVFPSRNIEGAGFRPSRHHSGRSSFCGNLLL